MALLLVLGPRLLPEYRDPDAGRLDLVSAALSLVAVLAVIFGLKQIAQDGLGSARRRRRAGRARDRRRVRAAPAPAGRPDDRPRACSAIPAFNAALATNVLGIFVAVGYFLFVAQYLQLVLGLVAAGGGPVVAAVGGRVHRRSQARAAHRAPVPARHT